MTNTFSMIPDGCATDPSGMAALIVDAPNIDAVTGRLFGRAPRRGERFDPLALSEWAQRRTVSATLERSLFTNAPQVRPPGFEGWINALIDDGWRVWVRPKRTASDDIDDAMLAYLESRTWMSVTVFSHDAACFAQPLARLASGDVTATVLGFTECAGRLPITPGVQFVDVENICGLYRVPPPRLRLDRVPEAGGWIERAVI